MTLDDLLKAPQFSIPQEQKEAMLLPELNRLSVWHAENCLGYRRVENLLFERKDVASLADVPFVPVGIFKSHLLKSVPNEKVFRTLSSSGTSGQTPSRIILDKTTATLQTQALSRIMMHVLGSERLPMLLLDNQATLRDRSRPSAQAAATLGMMSFGRNHVWLLDEHEALDIPALDRFLKEHGSRPFLLFGFTYLVWTKLFSMLTNSGRDFSNCILIHGGGWKRMQEIAVGHEEFKRELERELGLRRVYNFYGMAEQVGSIFLEGEDGLLYAPNFADVIVRHPDSWQPLPAGEAGVLQVLSLLPRSYPGHSILTEDLGVIEAIDSGSCGRLGKGFRVLGRLPKAELRGCSDVRAEHVSG